MRATLHLTRANLRKGKDLAVIFVIILAVASMLLELGMITVLDYKQNFYRRVEQIHSPDMVFTAIMEEAIALEFQDKMMDDERSESSYHYPIQYVFDELQYGNGTMSLNLTVLPLEVFQNGNDFEVLEEQTGIEHPIYLPYIFKDGGGYRIGDSFSIMKTAQEEFNYEVAGFYDSFYLGTVNNGIVSVALPQEEYDAMASALQHRRDGYLIGASLLHEEDQDAFCISYTESLKSLLPSTTIVNTTNLSVTMKARTITSDIGSYLILFFSMIVSAVAILMIRYRVRNSVEENSINIGALKAMGYTNAQICNASILQFSAVGLLGIGLGCTLGYLAIPFLSNIYSVQTGTKWSQGFDLLATTLTFTLLEGWILLTCYFATRSIKKLTVLRAFRFGIATHNFRGNPIPLHKKGPLVALLGAKLLCHHRAQAIVVGMIAFMITFCGMYTGILSLNFTFKNDLVVNSIMGEVADVFISMQDYNLALGKEKIEALDHVDKVIYYTQNEANYEDHSIMLNIMDDFNDLNSKYMLYEGRYPKYDDEIAINGLMAKENNINVGDQMEVTFNGSSRMYLITGLIQSSTYMGYDVYLREDGIQRLNADFQPDRLFVYSDDTISAEALKQSIQEEFQGVSISYGIFDDQVQSQLGIFQTMILVITQMVGVISFALIFLILYLMIETILLQKRQYFGIQKAIGYTTKQLQLQVAISFLPQMILGSCLGNIAAYNFINPLCSMLFSTFGWMKVNFEIPWYLMIGITTAITFIAFFLAMMLTRKMRKISPYALLSE